MLLVGRYSFFASFAEVNNDVGTSGKNEDCVDVDVNDDGVDKADATTCSWRRHDENTLVVWHTVSNDLTSKKDSTSETRSRCSSKNVEDTLEAPLILTEIVSISEPSLLSSIELKSVNCFDTRIGMLEDILFLFR